MAKSSPFVDRMLLQLAPLGPVRARAMFGGFGVYLDDLMFALIAWDRLFFKVDGESLPAFKAARAKPFVYDQGGQSVTMSYWEPQKAAFEDAASLMPWAEKGLAAAQRARAAKRGRARGATKNATKPGRTTR